MIRRRMLVMGAALLLLTGSCATVQDMPARFMTVTIEKPVHFSAPDGADVMAAPGRYHVDSIEDAKLQLTPAESAAGSSPLIVAAMALPHEEPVESRVALSVPNGEDEHHVVLLMPDGKGLDAGGTYSGLRSRGGSIAPLPMAQLQAAFVQPGPIVRKDGTPYGRLEGMITVYHLDFFSYAPPSSPLRNGHENIDGTLRLQQYDGAWRPLTVQQAKGHGLKAFPYTSDFHGNPNEDGIIYFPSRTTAGVPPSGHDRHVDYRLIDFFAPSGLWQRQLDEALLSRNQALTFAKWGTLKGDGGGGCGSGITATCATDSPPPPWAGADHDDGPTDPGDPALDPAHLVAHYFTGLGNFSTKYMRNRYITDLKNRGYHHGQVPRGWAKEIMMNNQTVMLDDRTDRINIDELFTKLTTTCP